jgi:hypothetical protein
VGWVYRQGRASMFCVRGEEEELVMSDSVDAVLEEQLTSSDLEIFLSC